MTEGRSNHLRPISVWLVFCAFWSCSGWVLSALHCLNTAGYTGALIVGIVASILYLQRRGMLPSDLLGRNLASFWHKLRQRFSRPLPLSFLVLASMAFLGGALYPPSNYDGMAYRLPRFYHWLAHGQWHWIPTLFPRLNTRAADFEWVCAPFLVFLRSDRALFLLNTISFLLLPGLIFSVFTRLGVRPRVAWYWMWLAPTGYGFILQAGSICNDLFAAPFALAAIDFALRAKQSGRVHEVWLSILAAALMTGSKAINLLLLLPWFVAAAPSLLLLRRRVVAGLGIGLVAATVSLLPTMILNIKYCGEWSGARAEGLGGAHAGPLLRVANNSILFAIQNLMPPINPFAEAWNNAVPHIQGQALRARL